MTFDRFFKIALLSLLSVFLYLGWGMKDNGRYVMARDDSAMLDSRTGTRYLLNQSGIPGALSLETHPQTGEVEAHYIWQRH